MERERITISIKKKVLDQVDSTIDGSKIRNRSHAIETLALKAMGGKETKNAVILLGGDNALKAIPATKDILYKLKEASFEQVTIAIGFLGPKIKEKLGDGSEFGLKIDYSVKGEGSGGAVASLKNKLNQTFIVFNTDKTIKRSLEFLLKYHKKHANIATVATDNLNKYNGIYLFEPEIFEYIPKGFSMLEEDVFPKLSEKGEIAVFPL